MWNIQQVLLSGRDDAPVGCAFDTVNEEVKIYLKVQGTLDAKQELAKIKNKMADIEK